MIGRHTCLTVRAVVFDLDGVVVDSNAVIERAWREAAGAHGRSISAFEMARYVHGLPGQHTVAALFPDHTPAQRKQIWDRASQIEESARCNPIPGVVPLLHHLHAARVPVGLVTSAPPARARRTVESLRLDGVFTTMVTRVDSARGKPHADPYLLAAARTGTSPAEMLVFEDSAGGIAAAVGAGARVVAVGRADPGDPAVVGTVVDFTEMTVRTTVDGGLALTGLPRPISVLTG